MPLSVRLSLSRFLDPVLMVLVLLAIGLYLLLRAGTAPGASAIAARRWRWGRGLACSAWAGLWLASLPIVADALTRCTETRGPDLSVALAGKRPERTALVVLAAARRTYDPDVPPREAMDAASTQRVLTAARLWREHGFGLVVLSGAPAAETDAMRDLAVSLGVPGERVVLETASLNTRENAADSARILQGWGPEAVVLVTSATHLRRAVKDFAAAGVTVIPAAADVHGRAVTGVDSFLPLSSALGQTNACMHELLGYLRG